MRKVKVYSLTTARNIEEMVNLVKRDLDANVGWEPFGPCQECTTQGAFYYLQTMVIYKEDKNVSGG